MTAQELTANIFDRLFVHDQPGQNDQVIILSLTTQALRTAHREGLLEAAKFLLYDENNVLDWTPMMRQTAGVFARAIRAQAAKEEA
jgi:hypothetical protein